MLIKLWLLENSKHFVTSKNRFLKFKFTIILTLMLKKSQSDSLAISSV